MWEVKDAFDSLPLSFCDICVWGTKLRYVGKKWEGFDIVKVRTY